MDSVEVYVLGIADTPSGEKIVVVVPNNNAPLKPGDTFKLRYEFSRDDIINQNPNPTRLNCMPVELKVVRIDYMRASVDLLSHGVTGGLSLSGSGFELITTGCFLRTTEP